MLTYWNMFTCCWINRTVQSRKSQRDRQRGTTHWRGALFHSLFMQSWVGDAGAKVDARGSRMLLLLLLLLLWSVTMRVTRTRYWKLGVSWNQIVGRMWPGHHADTVTLTYCWSSWRPTVGSRPRAFASRKSPFETPEMLQSGPPYQMWPGRHLQKYFYISGVHMIRYLKSLSVEWYSIRNDIS